MLRILTITGTCAGITLAIAAVNLWLGILVSFVMVPLCQELLRSK